MASNDDGEMPPPPSYEEVVAGATGTPTSLPRSRTHITDDDDEETALLKAELARLKEQNRQQQKELLKKEIEDLKNAEEHAKFKIMMDRYTDPNAGSSSASTSGVTTIIYSPQSPAPTAPPVHPTVAHQAGPPQPHTGTTGYSSTSTAHNQYGTSYPTVTYHPTVTNYPISPDGQGETGAVQTNFNATPTEGSSVVKLVVGFIVTLVICVVLIVVFS